MTINSVGLECYLDRVEVTGSNPVWSTKINLTNCGVFVLYEKKKVKYSLVKKRFKNF